MLNVSIYKLNSDETEMMKIAMLTVSEDVDEKIIDFPSEADLSEERIRWMSCSWDRIYKRKNEMGEFQKITKIQSWSVLDSNYLLYEFLEYLEPLNF